MSVLFLIQVLWTCVGMSVSNFGPKYSIAVRLRKRNLDELDPQMWSTEKWNLPLDLDWAFLMKIIGKNGIYVKDNSQRLIVEADAISQVTLDCMVFGY